MISSLLNVSEKIDQPVVALYDVVSNVADQLDIPFVVVGASARDIVLHYGYDVPVQRATRDVDFGIQVSDWAAFHVLRDELIENGFSEAGAFHRLISPENIPVDIVPFGDLQDENSNIQWSPEGDFEMNVLGFQEVCNNAERVRIQDDPVVDIPVATPEGMAILKIIAWMDRDRSARRKDAKDLVYLLTTYEKIPSINHELYNDNTLMEQYDWDLELASAHQLGIDAESISEDQTYNTIADLLEDKHESLSSETLIEEMCSQIEREFERNEQLLNAFADGFLYKKSSES